MPPLYVTAQNSKIRLANQRLQVESGGSGETQVLASLPIGQVTQVVVFGNVGLTTPAIQRLLGAEIEVIFLSEDGVYLGRLESRLTPHVPLRQAQYQGLQEPGFKFAMAKGFVQAKLSHQRALLQRHNRERGDAEIASAIDALGRSLDSLPGKANLHSLLGLEGSATAAYFNGLRRLFDPSWNFKDRNRRPPRDPVNVLLSFGYTLMTNLARSAVEAVGLDPYAGFLHEIAYNRPALGLDLLEEFRPVVDGLVLWCLNGKQIEPEDFSPGPSERPVILSQEAARKFAAAFETRMAQKFTHPLRQMQFPLNQCLLEQARQLASRITGGTPGYTGMGFR
jgi:CRISPR-associated protein Cas1